MNSEELSKGLEIMLYGMGTTFFMLILFYTVIRLLNKVFPIKDGE